MSPNREVTHGQHRQRVRRRSSDDRKIADGIAKALRETDDDVRMAAKGWSKDIEKGLGKPTVEVDADTISAKKEIEKVEKGRYTAKVKVDVDQASLAKASAKSKPAISTLPRHCCSTDTLADECICNQWV